MKNAEAAISSQGEAGEKFEDAGGGEKISDWGGLLLLGGGVSTPLHAMTE